MDRNDADRRLLWALIATMAVLYVWSTWFAPKAQPPPATPTEATAPASTPTESAPPTSPAPGVSSDIPERTVQVGSPGWSGELRSKDGALHALSLVHYRSEPIVRPIWLWVVDKVRGDRKSVV